MNNIISNETQLRFFKEEEEEEEEDRIPNENCNVESRNFICYSFFPANSGYSFCAICVRSFFFPDISYVFLS